MKKTTTTRFTVVLGTVLVMLLALSGVAWAAGPLAVTKTMPNSGAIKVAPTANVKAYFNHNMRASTVTSATFKIRKQGTTTWLGATRSVNNAISPTSANRGSQGVVTLNPRANLASNTTYQVMIVGGNSGVKDVNGKALSKSKIWAFTTVATPPDTTIGSGPTGTVNSASANFSFSSSKAGSTFQCSRDGSAFAACTSPKSYSSLSQGSHTFEVRAIDAQGSIDPTPASRTWTVDTIAPTVNNVSPANTATDVAIATNVTATFSETMDSSSISDQIFTLTQQGSLSPVAATVSYNSSTSQATLSPSSNLAWNTTYTANITTGMKDSAGNALKQSHSWTFTTRAPIEATPSTVDFVFAYCPGTPSPVRNVTLNNISTESLTIFPNVSGPDASSFSVPTDSITLVPSETALVPVTFTPSGAWGARTGSLDLKDINGNTMLSVPLKAAVKCPVEG